ncbi:MAG: plasmid stabilization protein [Candidatus Gracilibacteria bacterium]
MPKLIFTESYEKRAARFLKQHPQLINQYRKTLILLSTNPAHPSLHLHKLRGKLSPLHSVSINRSYRITLQFIIKKDSIIPIDVGKHDDVY